LDAYDQATGSIGAEMRGRGVRSTVASPVFVSGRLWGVVRVASKTDPMPADAELRIVEFTELVATAISNLQARSEVKRLAEEQAALRRVATLVAEGAAVIRLRCGSGRDRNAPGCRRRGSHKGTQTAMGRYDLASSLGSDLGAARR
jgi:hypothetical protein